eukprot:9926932-Alexandrium_andersonii.AAC.1
MHPSRASGTDVEAVLGPAQFQVRTPTAISAFSNIVDATRFDRFDSLLGSIGTRCTCHRVSPWRRTSLPAPLQVVFCAARCGQASGR